MYNIWTLVERPISGWALNASQWQPHSAILCFRADPLRSGRLRLEWMTAALHSACLFVFICWFFFLSFFFLFTSPRPSTYRPHSHSYFFFFFCSFLFFFFFFRSSSFALLFHIRNTYKAIPTFTKSATGLCAFSFARLRELAAIRRKKPNKEKSRGGKRPFFVTTTTSHKAASGPCQLGRPTHRDQDQ